MTGDLIFFMKQQFDAVVGDTTITANKSLYVDFTLPYTDLGVGMVARIGNKNMWIFSEPLDVDLWITIVGFVILIGFVIWIIEHPINEEFQGSPAQQVGTTLWFSFSTLVYAHSKTSLPVCAVHYPQCTTINTLFAVLEATFALAKAFS